MIPSDLDIRNQSLNPRQSFIVEAPAGSGKTELLIQRYLKLLGGVSQPEEILAMTFTRKAAGEMKARIIEALNRAQDISPPEKAHQQTTWNLAKVALERNQKFGWKLLENPARLRVVTIDSFCSFLTKRTPLLSKIGGATEIQENIQDLHATTAKRILSKMESSNYPYAELVRALLQHLDNDKKTFINRISELLNLRDQWMISFFDKFENIKEHLLDNTHKEKLEKIYTELIEKHLTKTFHLFPESLKTPLITFGGYAGKNLNIYDSENPITALSQLDSFPNPKIKQLNQWKGISNFLLTSTGEFRKRVDRNLGFPVDNKDIKNDFKIYLESLTGLKPLLKALNKIKLLPDPCFSDYEWNILRTTLRLLPELQSQLKSLLQENKLSDFSEISLAALKSFGNELEPTDLGKYLDDKIQHILVDEYQDTSFKQEELLKKLTAEWEPDSGRTLFIVGDPKQSIYRFRDAEVGLFLKTQKEGINNLNLDQLTLESNFRSQQSLVDWNNRCFQKILPEEDNPDSGAIAFSKSTAIHAKEAYPGVVLHPLDPKLNPSQASRSEAKEISRVIKKIRGESAEASIAILVRSRIHLKEIIRELELLKISYKAESIYNLADRPAIRDLLSLLRALIFPLDRVAWLSLLRAPWAGVSLSDIHALCVSQPEIPVWEILNKDENKKRLSKNGKIQIKRLISVLLPTIHALPSNNFRELLENCWIRLGGPACHKGTSETDIVTFFDEVERCIQKGEPNQFEHFNQVIENLYASPLTTSKNAIQIMTMHKAKGLEFDYVILPGLGKKSQNDSKRLVFWMPYGQELLLAPLEAKGEKESRLYNFLAEIDNEKDEHEMLRLLYVSTTRAKKQLHLLGKTKVTNDEMIPESNSLLESLWPFLKDDWCKETKLEEKLSKQEEVKPSAEMYPIERIPSGYQPPQPLSSIHSTVISEIEEEKEIFPFLWAGTAARCIGNVLHRVLETIAKEGLDKWMLSRIKIMAPQLRIALLGEGLPLDQVDDALHLTLTGLQNTLEDTKGRWILSNHEESHAEYSLTLFLENRFIRNVIDRTFIENKTRWIIDYKTSRHEGKGLENFLKREAERYKPQLSRYEALLKEYGETCPIRKALYFPLIKEWIEI